MDEYSSLLIHCSKVPGQANSVSSRATSWISRIISHQSGGKYYWNITLPSGCVASLTRDLEITSAKESRAPASIAASPWRFKCKKMLILVLN